MRTNKKIEREAKHLFRLCQNNGRLDQTRVRKVIESILQLKRRGSLALAGQFERLVRLELLKHTAEVESATPLSTELKEKVEITLATEYGPGITTSFVERPELIGGMRVRVADDVYDGSIKNALAVLAESF
jgi:F-type H+-transporting ATPase subunit delta